MKLLLDENLSRRIVPFFQADYPDSTQIALANMESASDLDQDGQCKQKCDYKPFIAKLQTD